MEKLKRSKLPLVIFITLLAISGLLITRNCESAKRPGPKTVLAVSTQSDTRPTEERISDTVKHTLENATNTTSIAQLRKFPYPYDAMLAISSDIDNTTVEKFETYHQFLNTLEQTSHGPGLGLDIGDSAWFYVVNDSLINLDKEGHRAEYSMSYFQGLNPNSRKDADKISNYYKVGWIDSLHSFGDFSRNDRSVKFTRDLAVAAWKAMNDSGFKPKVWINHGSESNVQNFGAYNPKTLFKYQAGDDPKSPYYHTDLTIDNGIRYVWNSIGMSQFSYDNPLFPIKLRDGRQVWGFQRYTHDVVKGKYDWTWETHELHRQITKQRLEQLVQERKFSIVAQHLGKGSDGFPFNPIDIQALQLLKAYQDEGKVLVARTSRLLDYARAQKFVRYSIVQIEGKTYININSIEDSVLEPTTPTMDEIRGLTFYVDDPDKTYVLLNLTLIPKEQLQRNGPDRSSEKSIGVKWYMPDYTDYSQPLIKVTQ
ncbi:MAG TPA: hypothetical protein VMW91_12540 [Desulfosporosinus sp.]|nr:hypothetical protein [Desulfosporosinus sp.]